MQLITTGKTSTVGWKHQMSQEGRERIDEAQGDVYRPHVRGSRP